MNKKIKFGLFVVIALLVLIVGISMQQSGLVSVENLESFIESSGAWAPLVFTLLYIFITLFGISAALFTILAGSLFGTVTGLIIVVIAATISAAIAFSITRFFRGEENSKKKSKDHGVITSIIEKIEHSAEDKGFITIVILRLSFLPYIPLSYASGLVRSLKFSDFILATFITNIFGSFVFIYLGDRLAQVFRGNADPQTLVTLGIAVVLLIAFVVFVPKIARTFTHKKNG